MSKFEANNVGAGPYGKPSLVDDVAMTLFGEVGLGPKAFYKESDQFLRDPNFLASHPEYWVMPGQIVSTPLQLGWKGVDDTLHLAGQTVSDEFNAGKDLVIGAVDPLIGTVKMGQGLYDLVTGNVDGFVHNELTGLKDLTIEPLWQGVKAVGDALHPVATVLEHPLHAAGDVIVTGAKVIGDGISAPIDVVKGGFDLLKAPVDLFTGPGKAASDVGDAIKHTTVDVVKDGYHAVSHAVNGIAHAVFDLF